jgi:hypothetical protein
MQEVLGAVTVVDMHLIETLLRHGRSGDHIRPDGREFLKDALYVCASPPSAVIGVFHGYRCPLWRLNAVLSNARSASA